jgi:hypothetical protein
MISDRQNQSHRFQFSLRILFLVIAASAVSCWSYSIGWPRWQAYRDQARFEASIKHIQRGDLIYEIWGLLNRPERGIRGVASNAQGNPVGWIQYEWPNAVYFVYCPLQTRAGGNPEYDLTVSVEVFRLPPVPRGYVPHTVRGRNALPDPTFAYTRDFLEFIGSDRQHNPGFDYELIHADLPTRSI